MPLIFFVMQCFALFFGVDATATLESLPTCCHESLNDVLSNYFPDVSRNEISITPLIGGHSNTCLKICTPTQCYVLRIKDKDASEKSLKRELFAMQEAANLGIAPQVFYVSPDNRAILMDFIEGDTATIAQMKLSENCARVADTLRKAHTIKKNPYFEEDSNETAANVYSAICENQKIRAQLDEALKLMWKYNEKLQKFNSCKVNIHGELNSRNIFITDKNVIFIDWEYTSWEDPFSDLSYLALRLDYDANQELLLLKSYLQHMPSADELERYYLTKKINFAQLCIFFHYFSLKFNQDNKDLDDRVPLKNWSYYMSLFSDQPDDEQSLAQFYYDLARCCLNYARE